MVIIGMIGMDFWPREDLDGSVGRRDTLLTGRVVDSVDSVDQDGIYDRLLRAGICSLLSRIFNGPTIPVCRRPIPSMLEPLIPRWRPGFGSRPGIPVADAPRRLDAGR
jgi:hypothetical protein